MIFKISMTKNLKKNGRTDQSGQYIDCENKNNILNQNK